MTLSNMLERRGSNWGARGDAEEDVDRADEGISSRICICGQRGMEKYSVSSHILLIEIMKSRNPTSMLSGLSKRRSLDLYICG